MHFILFAYFSLFCATANRSSSSSHIEGFFKLGWSIFDLEFWDIFTNGFPPPAEKSIFALLIDVLFFWDVWDAEIRSDVDFAWDMFLLKDEFVDKYASENTDFPGMFWDFLLSSWFWSATKLPNHGRSSSMLNLNFSSKASWFKFTSEFDSSSSTIIGFFLAELLSLKSSNSLMLKPLKTGSFMASKEWRNYVNSLTTGKFNNNTEFEYANLLWLTAIFFSGLRLLFTSPG